LCFDLLDEKDQARAVKELAKLLGENKDHLNTGFVGTPVLCEALTRFGRHDLACKLVLLEDYPSWLYPITKGATTIWEHWDGIKPDGSFWSADMNSFNHYSYGAIGDWFYRHIAGIDQMPDSAGYRHSLIRPIPGHGFYEAQGSLKTPYGQLATRWQAKDGVMELFVTVPVGTNADVVLPGAAGARVTEGGKAVQSAEGVAVVGPQGADLVLTVGSGQYAFAWPWTE
jgi:alpha-L-rhamnosidase